MERKQFTFYGSFASSIWRIKNKDARLAAYDAITHYALEGTAPDLDKIPDAAAIVFDLCMPNLDAARRKSAGGKNKDKSKIAESIEQDTVKIAASKGQDSVNKKEKENEIEIEIENECSPTLVSLKAEKKDAGKIASSTDDGFEAFWAAYPVKTGNIDGAFFHYRAALETTTAADLLAALERQRAYWDEQGSRFTPSAEKWLKNRMWLMEPKAGKEPKRGPMTAAEYNAKPHVFVGELDELEKMLEVSG